MKIEKKKMKEKKSHNMERGKEKKRKKRHAREESFGLSARQGRRNEKKYKMKR